MPLDFESLYASFAGSIPKTLFPFFLKKLSNDPSLLPISKTLDLFLSLNFEINLDDAFLK